jgi:hypothetical protein
LSVAEVVCASDVLECGFLDRGFNVSGLYQPFVSGLTVQEVGHEVVSLEGEFT